MGSRITKEELYNFDGCKCEFYKINFINRDEIINFYLKPSLLTDKIIKKEKSSRGWSMTAESADYILNFRKKRSKNTKDMNCIEWLVYGMEIGGIKVPSSILTAGLLRIWAKKNLIKV